MKMNEFLLKFKRITSSNDFIPQIDGLRFLAISAVLVFHFQGKLIKNLHFSDQPNAYLFHRLFAHGDFGVELFFVISGFILALPFARYYLGLTNKKIPLKKYFLRRVTRLEPPYFLVVIGCFLVYVIVDPTIKFKTQLPNVLSALIYSHNIIYKDFLKVDLVTWSLEIEVQFYILAPLLAKIFKLSRIPRRLILVGVILLIPLLHSYFPSDVRWLYSYIHYFLIGFLLIDFYLQEESIKIPKIISFLIGATTLFFIFYISSKANKISLVYAHIALIFVLYMLVLKNGLWKNIFSNLWMTTIGGMCYTIYLLHFPLMGFLMKGILNFNISNYFIPNFIFQFVIVMSVVLVVSGTFFILIEKPCMRKDWYKHVSVPFLYKNNKQAA